MIAYRNNLHISSLSLYTIKLNPLTYSLMFSEQIAPIGTYDIPIDSEFHADGCMEAKNDPQVLTGCYLVNDKIAGKLLFLKIFSKVKSKKAEKPSLGQKIRKLTFS